MSTEKKQKHIRGVKITSLSSFLGIVAGTVSWFLTELSGFEQIYGVYLLFITIAVQGPILPYLGKEEPGIKDWLYLTFMTGCLWFISWTILLTA